jgi:nicotinate-nucleotide adenylyltransferase
MGILNARSATTNPSAARAYLRILKMSRSRGEQPEQRIHSGAPRDERGSSPLISDSAKVGILSGTFDPIHAGHIAFALKAMEREKLEKVVFIPERVPRRKEGVTHYAHRVAMIRLALKPYQKLAVLELPDRQLNVQKTLPRLKRQFKGSELYLLLGSDMVDLLVSPLANEQWPDLRPMLGTIKIIVSVRGKKIKEEHRQKVDMLQPSALILTSTKPNASSRDIRNRLLRGKPHPDVLPSLRDYIKANWLYTSVTGAEDSTPKSS